MNTRFNLITLAVILGLTVLLFAGAGITGAAAQAAIPGDALYPVKMTLEQTRLSMASDAGDRAQIKMAFAEKRLNEIAALIEEGRNREINDAVLAFETEINGAILELEGLAQADPARSVSLAQEITRALTRYAQTLSGLVASAPEAVRGEVNRALTSTNTASRLEMPDDSLDDNSNANGNDNSQDDNSNSNANENSNDNGNDNGDDNGNDNGDDDSNSNDDNANGNDSNDDDDNSNANGNSNDDDSSNTNTSINDNDDDDNSNSSANDNSDDNGDDDSSNNNGDDNGSNDNGSDDSGNDNGDDSGSDNGNDNGDDNSGKGGD